jgi:hypothetical protein
MVRDDFDALSYVFGEEWTAANRQGRLLPDLPNRVGYPNRVLVFI